MQPQTLPDQYRVTFDLMAGIAPLTFPADATPAHITDRIHRAFLTADVIDDGHEFAVVVDVQAGTVVVRADGGVIEHGSITRVDEQPPAKPDYWLTLADDLRQAADRIATLAGTPAAAWARLDITGVAPQNASAASAAIVDALASAFGTEAYASDGGNVQRYGMGKNFGAVQLSGYTYLPLEDSELKQLRARVAELEAQQVEGGATR